MQSTSLTGADVIQINDRIIQDLADGESVKITYPNDIANVKSAKNGNMIFAFNETGRQVEVELRVLAGSYDDTYLNGELQKMKNDFSTFELMFGYFTKRVGDGTSNRKSIVYQCSGGVFKRQLDAMTSSEGNTDQSVVTYTIVFGNGNRHIQ